MTMLKHLIPLLLLAIPASAQTVWDGVYTEAQAKRGENTYLAECTQCHGETLLGAEGGPAITGQYFLAAWDGKTADVLVEKIRKTMPTDGPGFLSRAQSTELVAYIFSDNGFPVGDAEMAPNLTALKKIVIQAEK